MRSPTNISAVHQLMSEGIEISTVLDVGVGKHTWTLQQLFPDKKHILFEPMVEFKEVCEKDYEECGIDYELYNIAVSDVDDPNGQVFYNIHRMHKADQDINYIWAGAVPKDTETYHGSNHPKRDVEISTLDTFLADKNYDKPYYLKVDVDGGEMNVIRGAQNTLKYCSVIQVEACLQKGLDRTAWSNISWFESVGFRLWDVIDLYYIDDRLWQVDLVFIRSKEYKRINEDKKKVNRKDRRFTFIGDNGESYDFKP